MTSDSDTIETPDDLRALAAEARAWPFEEARKVVARIERAKTPPEEIIFETGYGPSGLPHIGTFGEVSRTSMVRHAFAQMSDIKTRIVCFSDDMDGLRKVPDNIPNQEMVAEHLGKPLTRVPDPFGTHDSFGAHNNARLQSFLDDFGFDYEFVSATECYTNGRFDAMLLTMLERHQKVLDIMLPTLGEERRKTYSPFLPLCPRTGQVLLAAVEKTDPKAGTIVYRDPETDALVEVPVTGGACKLQWKADWAMRWAALGVDYEMSGKDLIDSVKASSQICRVLGAEPPDGFSYELFLDENGEKISKSRGNGLTIEEWLAYASPESLQLFMYQGPRKAKRLYFDVIPRNVDDYLTFLEKYPDQSAADRLSNPAWHIHGGEPPARDVPISFNVLLNLVSASNAEDKDVLWGFIGRYAPDASPEKNPGLDQLAGYAVRYFHDFVKPTKTFRLADDKERAALEALSEALAKLPADADAEAIQFEVYEIGKAHGFEPLRDWFTALYEVLLGQSQGPRFGSFAALYGLEETRALIAKGLTGELAG